MKFLATGRFLSCRVLFAVSALFISLKSSNATAANECSVGGRFLFSKVLKLGTSTSYIQPRITTGKSTSAPVLALSSGDAICKALGHSTGEVGAIETFNFNDRFAALIADDGSLKNMLALTTELRDVVSTVTCR